MVTMNWPNVQISRMAFDGAGCSAVGACSAAQRASVDNGDHSDEEPETGSIEQIMDHGLVSRGRYSEYECRSSLTEMHKHGDQKPPCAIVYPDHQHPERRQEGEQQGSKCEDGWNALGGSGAAYEQGKVPKPPDEAQYQSRRQDAVATPQLGNGEACPTDLLKYADHG